MSRYAFNRRMVVDAMVWLEAPSATEAKRLLKAGHMADSVTDDQTRSVTYRRLPSQDKRS